MIAVTAGVSLLITGMISFVTKLINEQGIKRANEELIQSYKNNVSSNNENIKKLKELSSEYENIKSKIINQIELNEAEKSTLEELIKINPSLVKGYNERGEAIIDTTQNIKDMIEELERANEIEDIKLAEGGKNLFKEAKKDSEKFIKEIEEINFKITNILEGVKVDTDYYKKTIVSLNELKEQYRALSEEENMQKVWNCTIKFKD